MQWGHLSERISAATGRPFELERRRAVAGGSVHLAYQLSGSYQDYFMKLAARSDEAMLTSEVTGLEALAKTDTVRVPRVIARGVLGNQAYLLLEYMALQPLEATSSARLGEQLAATHRHTGPRFGFSQANYIGRTQQVNMPSDDWLTFWHQRRLGFQLQLAQKNGYRRELDWLGADVLDVLPALFDGYTPQPSLLHGDLWTGNVGALADGTPVIYDPAVYYGDREADIAMTELFGGFNPSFYAAYRATWPLDAGYEVRKHLYNLYHLLNHLNLYGKGYLPQCLQAMERLAAEVH